MRSGSSYQRCILPASEAHIVSYTRFSIYLVISSVTTSLKKAGTHSKGLWGKSYCSHYGRSLGRLASFLFLFLPAPVETEKSLPHRNTFASRNVLTDSAPMLTDSSTLGPGSGSFAQMKSRAVLSYPSSSWWSDIGGQFTWRISSQF